ncbi:MAG: M36 family metallopeptidase, partial [Kofleriaceae bacterium]
PYSTDMTKNPLTFRHIANGVTLPVGPPLAFGADGASNAEVHNTGEVWATMLWECYAALLRDTLGPAPRLTFAQAQARMKRYLISALKVTPQAPTFLDARDALLAVALASDPIDYVAFKIAFTKRGAGIHAVSPDRFSATNVGVVEDFSTGPELAFDHATLDDGLTTCDADGAMDAGEYGRLMVVLRNTGTTTLTATTASISTGSPDVWYPNGNTLTFAAMAPGATATSTLRLAYRRTVVGIQQLDLQIDYTDAQLTGGPLTQLAGFRTNTDEIPASSALDTVEPVGSPWAPGFSPTFGNLAPWQRVEVTPLQHSWHVEDSGVGTDQYLVSPVFTVDGSGSFNLQVDHSWSFEFDGGGNYDGGVVELSVNGGAFADIGASAYNGTILNYSGDVNPLKGRVGFVQSSGGTVHTSLTQAIAPGSTAQVRFRAASDSSIGALGWTLDNIAFTGVVETPFATVVANDSACTEVPVSADLAISVDDGVATVTAGNAVTYTITASNAGGDDIIGATVSDTFSSDLSACTWTCTGSGGGTCLGAGAGDLATQVTLPASSSVTFLATCTVSISTASTTLSNTATVTLPGPVTDPVPGNNTALDSDLLIHLPALLTAGKTVTGSFVQGGTVSYAIVVSNSGTGTQLDNPGNELTDVLPAGLTLVSASATTGTAVATLGTNTVAWNGAIAAGASTTITIIATVTAAPGDTVSNQASFLYDSDGNATNDTAGTTEAFQCD